VVLRGSGRDISRGPIPGAYGWALRAQPFHARRADQGTWGNHPWDRATRGTTAPRTRGRADLYTESSQQKAKATSEEVALVHPFW
jgi:hypothetical protein